MSREVQWTTMGRKISTEEETSAGIESGSASRSRGAGCCGQLFPSGILTPSLRNEHGDGPGFGIVSRISRKFIVIVFVINTFKNKTLENLLSKNTTIRYFHSQQEKNNSL